jgi:hypothetical protein
LDSRPLRKLAPLDEGPKSGRKANEAAPAGSLVVIK